MGLEAGYRPDPASNPRSEFGVEAIVTTVQLSLENLSTTLTAEVTGIAATVTVLNADAVTPTTGLGLFATNSCTTSTRR